MSELIPALILLVFLGGICRLMWVRGWQPIGIVLLVVGWRRLVFYVRWLVYERRYDRVHEFIDLAEQKRRQPVAGLVENRSDDPTKI